MTYPQPGQQMKVSFVLADGPILFMPDTVVADRPDLIMHYFPDGTRSLRRVAVDGSPPPRVIPARGFGTVVRSRARSVAQVLVQLPFHREMNIPLATNAGHVIREVLTEAGFAG